MNGLESLRNLKRYYNLTYFFENLTERSDSKTS